jgi:hypothetical protein
MYIGGYEKYVLFMSDYIRLEFSQHIFQIIQISYFMRICPLEAELSHADEWTDIWADMVKLIVAYCNFLNMPTNEKCIFWIAVTPLLPCTFTKKKKKVDDHGEKCFMQYL